MQHNLCNRVINTPMNDNVTMSMHEMFLRINSELITKYQWLHCPKDTEMAFHEMCYETNCQQYFVCKINSKLYLPLNRKRNLSGKLTIGILSRSS